MRLVSRFTLLLFFVFFGAVSSVNSYRFLHLQDIELCPYGQKTILEPIKQILGRKGVRLDYGSESAVVVEQSFNSSSFKKLRTCTFRIDATQHSDGLFIIIRKLNLRRKNDQECLDYVRFRWSNESYSERICGEVKNGVIKAYEETHGKVQVEVLIEPYVPFVRDDDMLEFSIVFTGYGACNSYRIPCRANDSSTCISADFQQDGVTNCPWPCLDEGGCLIHDDTNAQKLDTSNIALTAITSLIFTMVAFGGCLWCCFKYRQCVRDLAADPPASRERGGDDAAAQLELAPHGRVPPAQAPSAPVPDEKDDLPPPYDSLFPG